MANLRKRNKQSAMGFEFSTLNPIPHLSKVKSLDTAKQEWPWLAGTAATIGAAIYAFMKFGRKHR